MRRQGTALVLAAFLLMLMVMSATARQIEVWTGALSDSDITWMQTNLAPKFAKAKGIDVVFKRISGQEMNDQLNNKQGPDVLMYSGGGATRGAMGYLQPLNRYFDRWADRQKISANVLVYDAKKNLYLIPTDVTFYGVSYNKDAFKRAGVSTTALPSSWEALRSTAQKLILRWDNRIVRTGIETAWDIGTWLTLLMQLGETGLSTDLKQSRLSSDNAVEALEYLASLHQQGYDPKREIYGDVGNSNGPFKFVDGLTAMAYAPTFIAHYTQMRNTKWQQEYGFFPLRRYPSVTPVAPGYQKGIGITPWSRDPQAAWDFITWFLSPEINVLYSAQIRAIPVRTDATAQITKLAPVLAQPYAALKYARLSPEVPITTFIDRSAYSSYTESLRKVLQGKLDAKSLLTQMQADAQVYLDWWWEQQSLINPTGGSR